MPRNKLLHNNAISIPNANRRHARTTSPTSRPTSKKRQGQSPIPWHPRSSELSCKGSLEQSPKRLLTRWHRDASPIVLYTCKTDKQTPEQHFDDLRERTTSKRRSPRSVLSTLSSRSQEDIETRESADTEHRPLSLNNTVTSWSCPAHGHITLQSNLLPFPRPHATFQTPPCHPDFAPHPWAQKGLPLLSLHSAVALQTASMLTTLTADSWI